MLFIILLLFFVIVLNIKERKCGKEGRKSFWNIVEDDDELLF